MSSAIQLKLYVGVGPAVAPAPRAVIEALTDVSVTTDTRGASGFQLTFSTGRNSALETLFLLSGGAQIPMLRVIIAVVLNGSVEVLADGLVSNHEYAPAGNGGSGSLTITGDSLEGVMDFFDLTGVPFPAMAPVARVALMVAKYAAFGIVPLTVPSVLSEIPNPAEQIPTQLCTDLDYIRALAAEAGYVFYIEPGPTVGMSTAYWGPEIRIGAVQSALNVDMDAHTNVESLGFSFDASSAMVPVVTIHEPITKAPIPVPIPDVSLLNPPLGLIPPIPLRTKQLTGLARRSPVAAALIGLKESAQASDAVTASGSLDVVRYGRVLKARNLVGVRGVSTAFNGLYYVTQVTHRIQPGSYTQDFSLVRNGLISTLSKVPA